MKKIYCLILTLCLLMCSVTGCGERNKDTDTTQNLSGETVSEGAKPMINIDTNTLWKEVNGMKYFDVPKFAENFDISEDASLMFPEMVDGKEVEGYYLDEKTYLVDKETMYRVLKKPFAGDGAIKWKDYRQETYGNPKVMFDGVLPVSRMKDPLYVTTCLPNEQSSYLESHKGRLNASNLCDPREEDVNILSIGAIYLNDELDLPDDTTITICLGRMTCLLKYKGEADWRMVKDIPKPDNPRSIYYLPWEHNYNGVISPTKLPDERVKEFDDHYEITLTVRDLKGYNTNDQKIDGSILHFWGEVYDFYKIDGVKGTDIEGFVTSYEVWVKEPEYAGYLTCDVGADIRTETGDTNQVFTGINFAVTGEPRVIYGHNVVPEKYDSVMDSEKVQKLIGLK